MRSGNGDSHKSLLRQMPARESNPQDMYNARQIFLAESYIAPGEKKCQTFRVIVTFACKMKEELLGHAAKEG